MTAVPFNFDVGSIAPDATADALEFDFSTGMSSLESLSTMLCTSPEEEEDQVALQRTIYHVAKPFSQAHIAPFAKSRVQYSIEQLKHVPKMMVEQNCTPWAHSMLYEGFMPRSLQDAHAACALYITRNDTTAEHAMRFITSRVEELSFSTLPTDPAEILARAQALMLYQIMLVFGGNVCVYGLAEALIPQLEEVGNGLLAIAAEQIDTVGALPLYPSTAARSAWRSYVFRESTRRTVLSLLQFTAMCNFATGSS